VDWIDVSQDRDDALKNVSVFIMWGRVLLYHIGKQAIIEPTVLVPDDI
jgi:hypothetical protein